MFDDKFLGLLGGAGCWGSQAGRAPGHSLRHTHQINPLTTILYWGHIPFYRQASCGSKGKNSVKVLGGLGLLTGRLHHAGPELGLFVQRVIVGAAQLVDVHTGWCAHAAVVADEHVKILQEDRDTEHFSPLLLCPCAITPQPLLNISHLYPVCLLI